MQALSERLDALLAGHGPAPGRPARLLVAQDLRPVAGFPEGPAARSRSGRRAKYLVWEFDDGNRIVLHLSQAGRLDIEEPPKKTKPRGAVARFVFGEGDAGLDGEGVGILVREYGTQRKASWWVLAPGDEGPWPAWGPSPAARRSPSSSAPATPGGTSPPTCATSTWWRASAAGWGDDILQRAKLSPFASLRSLDPGPARGAADRRHRGAGRGARARTHAPGRPLRVEAGRSLQGARALRRALPDPCGDTLERVSFESYEMAYCPTCQTGGKVLADRRLSRLLK